MNDRPNARQPDACAASATTCRHARRVLSDRGSQFVRCERAKTDPALPNTRPSRCVRAAATNRPDRR